MIGGAFINNGQNPSAMLAFLLYLIVIPLGIYIIKSLEKASCKEEMINKGIICLLFVSLIGGILILTSKDEIYRKSKPINQVTNYEDYKSSKESEVFKNHIESTKKDFENFLFNDLKIYNETDYQKRLLNLNNVESCYVKGMCILYGLYEERDLNSAIDNFLKASNLGNGEASYTLAIIYHFESECKNYELYRKYLNIAVNQNCEEAEQEWNEFFKDYIFKSKHSNTSLFNKITNALKINNDIELFSLIDLFISSILTLNAEVFNEEDSIVEMIIETYKENLKNAELFFHERNERKCMIITIKFVQNAICNDPNRNQINDTWIKYFGSNEALDGIKNDENNATLVAKHVAIIYFLCKEKQTRYNIQNLFLTTIMINMNYYVAHEELEIDDLANQYNNFVHNTLITSEGNEYRIPDDGDDEISLITKISTHCLFLINKIDNPSISDKDNIEFIISNYFKMKNSVDSICKNQLNENDKIYKDSIKTLLDDNDVIELLNSNSKGGMCDA